MANPPGRGWAALLTTRDGTHWGLSSLARGFTARVTGIGAVWFRPAGLQPVSITGSLSEPMSRVVTYSQVSLVSQNVDWWIVDHLSEDRFDGAEVTIYRESEGVLGDVIFSGYVLAERGVKFDGQSVTFDCTDVLGFFLPGKTVGGKLPLDLETAPNLEPPPVCKVIIEATGSSGSGDIVRIGIVDNGSPTFSLAFPYDGTWPLGPFAISDVQTGNRTFTVVGRAAPVDPAPLGDIIFQGTGTVTVTASGRVQMWICPEDVEGADTLAPETIENPDEGKPIPVIFGKMGDTHGHFAPCYVYDWGVSNEAQIRYVYVDYGDINGDPIHPVSKGNHDVIMVDTQPPQSKTDADGNEVPIEGARTFVDVATTIANGEAYYLRREGRDTVPGGLLTFHGPSGPGNRCGVFYLDTNIFNAWAQVLFDNEDLVFDPIRFKIFTQGGGARTANTDVLAVFNPDRKEAVGNLIRLLVDHAGVPPSKIDLATAALLQDSSSPDVRRYITDSENVEDLYAMLCQEAGLLSYIRSDGKVSWKRVNLSAPPPAVFRFDETSCIAGTMSVASQDWGPYFNAANGTTEQGFPYQDDAGHITVSERRNDEAISANDDVKVSTTITFGFLYVKQDMKDYIDAALAMQGLPSTTYSVSVHGIEPDAGPSARDLDSQFSVVAGDSLDVGFIGSREDSNVRRLIPARSLAMCLGFTHEPETDISTFTFWRFGFTVEAAQSVMLIMDGTEVFSAANGGAAIGTSWDTGWSNAKKAEAADYGSGKGGWISEGSKILNSETSDYSQSLFW